MGDMRTLIVALATMLIGPGLSPAAIHDDPVWLMFFVQGEGKRPTDKAASDRLMQGHLANMKKQASLGRLFAAGPLQDPTGERRGITVVMGANRKAVDRLFVGDPFVKADIMRVAAAKWKVSHERFEPNVDPNALVEHRLVLVKRGKGMSPESPQMRTDHETVMKSFAKDGPAVWGYVEGDLGIQEALIVVGKNEDAIREKLAKDPLFARSILEAEILPLWMSKGVIKG